MDHRHFGSLHEHVLQHLDLLYQPRGEGEKAECYIHAIMHDVYLTRDGSVGMSGNLLGVSLCFSEL